MYKILINDKQKDICLESIRFISQVLKNEDYKTFLELSKIIKKNNVEKYLIDGLKKKLYFDNFNSKSLEDLTVKINSNLLLTKEEILLVRDCLEAHSRLGISQVGIFYEKAQSILKVPTKKRLTSIDIEDIMAVSILREKLFNVDRNSFLGITGNLVNENFKISYEMYKVIDKHLAYERNPRGGYTVDFDGPLKITKEPLIEVKNEIS